MPVPAALLVGLGAALLFAVQPLAARQILPALGGAAAVWNTSLVFFQVLVLAGYLYAHALSQRLSLRQGVWVHLLVMGVAAAGLPIGLPEGWAPGEEPIGATLGGLILICGPAGFALAGSGTLLQAWYSRRPGAGDPWFLAVASNIGSFVGLWAQPLVLERVADLQTQSQLWSAGWGIYALGLAALGLSTPNAPARTPAMEPLPRGRAVEIGAWAALTCLLSMAVTTWISTDIAAVPLLWAVPLSAYLLTWILAFSAQGPRLQPILERLTPFAIAGAGLSMIDGLLGAPAAIGLQSLALLLVGAALHGRMAALRPSADGLTAFYLAASVGGALGGIAGSLLPPLLLNDLWEAPLAFAGAGLALAWRQGRGVLAIGLLAALSLGVAAAARAAWVSSEALALLFLAAALISLRAEARSGAALALGGLMVAALVMTQQGGAEALHRVRTFYGRHVVWSTRGGAWHVLQHGATVHGMQGSGPYREMPTGYYHRSGPVGDLFAVLPPGDVAIIGLGVGGLAAHQRPGDRFLFLELDPAVREIAVDPGLFTYLSDAAARVGSSPAVVVGDGRLLVEGSGLRADLLIVDAFSSDSIPVHLLTVEALRAYLRAVGDGIVVLHISNQYADLRPILGAAALELGVAARIREDGDLAGHEEEAKLASRWVMLAPQGVDLSAFALRAWVPLEPTPGIPAWTDARADILDALR
jgi:hypothetical protein